MRKFKIIQDTYGMSSQERSFWYTLIEIANEKHWPEYLFIGSKTIADQAKIAKESVKNFRKRFAELGLIYWVSDPKGGSKNAAQYKFLLNETGSVVAPYNPERGNETGSVVAPYNPERGNETGSVVAPINTNTKKKKNTITAPLETGAPSYTPEEKEKFKKFSDWIDTNSPRVNKMKEPITIDQFISIRKKMNNVIVTELLLQMHNWEPLLKKNRSAYLTLDNWYRRRETETKQVSNSPPTSLENYKAERERQFKRAAEINAGNI
jgi:hypothetical protein